MFICWSNGTLYWKTDGNMLSLIGMHEKMLFKLEVAPVGIHSEYFWTHVVAKPIYIFQSICDNFCQLTQHLVYNVFLYGWESTVRLRHFIVQIHAIKRDEMYRYVNKWNVRKYTEVFFMGTFEQRFYFSPFGASFLGYTRFLEASTPPRKPNIN